MKIIITDYVTAKSDKVEDGNVVKYALQESADDGAQNTPDLSALQVVSLLAKILGEEPELK